MGGDTEREVSLMSGKEVFKSLNLLGHQVVKVDGRDYKFLSHEDYKMDLNSRTITKNNQKLLYVYESCFSYKKNNYIYHGYIACRKDLSALDILWALNWQKRNIDKKYKNYICISSANKKNKFSNQHTKYLGYRSLKEDLKKLRKILMVNKNFNLYYRIV